MIDLTRLQPGNFAWLKEQAAKAERPVDNVAVEILDRHVRALRFFDPAEKYNPVPDLPRR